MKTSASKSKATTIMPLILGVGVLALSYVLPPMGGIGRVGWSAIAIVIFAIIFWVTEVLPAAATGMAILVLIPTMGVLGYQETFAHLGTVMIWRLMAIFMLTAAIQKVGLADRIAYGMLLLTKGNVKRTLLYVLILNFILSFIIPNSTARTTLCATVIASYLETAKVSKGSNIGKGFMIALPVISNITASAIMVGASVDIFAAEMFETLVGHTWTYMSWMVVNVPFCIAMTLVVFVATLIMFPPEQKQLFHGNEEIRQKLKDLGPMSKNAWFVLAVFCFLMVLWFTDTSESMPAEMLAALLLILPHRLQSLRWNEAISSVRWGIIILFGASIAMAAALQKSGAVNWLAETVFSHMNGIHPIFLIVLTITMTLLVRLGMSNMTGAVAILLPLLVTVASGVGVNPVWLGMICVVSSTGSFFYPAQAPTSLFTYNFGYYETKHFMRFGFIMFVLFNIVLVAIAMLYWPLAGLPVVG